MRILLFNPDNGVTRNFMPHLWMFLLKALTPPEHEVILVDDGSNETCRRSLEALVARPGAVLGHEFVGEVVAVGSNVSDFHPGDIVSGEGHVVCGRCRNCNEGRTGICLNVNPARPGAAYGYVDMGGWVGGQAEYVMVPYAVLTLSLLAGLVLKSRPFVRLRAATVAEVGGKVEVRYKPNDGRMYQAMPKNLADLRSDLPAYLTALVEGCLQKEPARRPRGATACPHLQLIDQLRHSHLRAWQFIARRPGRCRRNLRSHTDGAGLRAMAGSAAKSLEDRRA